MSVRSPLKPALIEPLREALELLDRLGTQGAEAEDAFERSEQFFQRRVEGHEPVKFDSPVAAKPRLGRATASDYSQPMPSLSEPSRP